MFFVLPETKGIPLEEIAAIFGDADEVMVFSDDIHVDHNTHELVIEAHGGHGLRHVGIEPGTEKGNHAGITQVEHATNESPMSESPTSESEKVEG
jgi:hypothetical protein